MPRVTSLLPREWMDPAKRPPRSYLFKWQLSLLDYYDRTPQIVNYVDDFFHKPVRNPHSPHSLRPFRTVFDFPPLRAALKDPRRRPRRMRQWQREILDCYDKHPLANMHLFDDWEGPINPFRTRRPDSNRVGPSAQSPKKVLSNVGKLVGADSPHFRPRIEPPFKTVTRKGLRKEREIREMIENLSISGEVVPSRSQPEERSRKMQDCRRREIYDSICSIESMICDIKQKLAFTE